MRHVRVVENLSLFALIYLQVVELFQVIGWESFIIRLDILSATPHNLWGWLRIFHYSPWYTYSSSSNDSSNVENLSLFALIYLDSVIIEESSSWESFIIRLDILIARRLRAVELLRIFHYSPWYTYALIGSVLVCVENLSLFALIYLIQPPAPAAAGWESFIIRLDILMGSIAYSLAVLRIFHYSPWYTYWPVWWNGPHVENLSLFALIYLDSHDKAGFRSWESFIIRLDILTAQSQKTRYPLRIFHYSPWYTYTWRSGFCPAVENLSLFALIYL